MYLQVPGEIPGRMLRSVQAAVAQCGTSARASLNEPRVLRVDAHAELRAPVFDIVEHLRASAEFQSATYPAELGAPVVQVFEAGAKGEVSVPAVDGMRNDVGVVVNLSDEAECTGGELVVQLGGAESSWRGAAGEIITFPANARLRVTEVTAGRRVLLTFQVQSLVSDPARRNVLSDFAKALRTLDQRLRGGSNLAVFRQSYDNLLRRWAENAPAS